LFKCLAQLPCSSHPSISALELFMTMLLQFVTPLPLPSAQQGGMMKENTVYATIFHYKPTAAIFVRIG
jgi:hypothetical protein